MNFKLFSIMFLLLTVYGCATSENNHSSNTDKNSATNPSTNAAQHIGRIYALNATLDICNDVVEIDPEKLNTARALKDNWLKNTRPDLLLTEEDTIKAARADLIRRSKINNDHTEYSDSLIKELLKTIDVSAKKILHDSFSTSIKAQNACRSPALLMTFLLEKTNKEIPVNALK